jgi:hypothetical protein
MFRWIKKATASLLSGIQEGQTGKAGWQLGILGSTTDMTIAMKNHTLISKPKPKPKAYSYTYSAKGKSHWGTTTYNLKDDEVEEFDIEATLEAIKVAINDYDFNKTVAGYENKSARDCLQEIIDCSSELDDYLTAIADMEDNEEEAEPYSECIYCTDKIATADDCFIRLKSSSIDKDGVSTKRYDPKAHYCFDCQIKFGYEYEHIAITSVCSEKTIEKYRKKPELYTHCVRCNREYETPQEDPDGCDDCLNDLSFDVGCCAMCNNVFETDKLWKIDNIEYAKEAYCQPCAATFSKHYVWTPWKEEEEEDNDSPEQLDELLSDLRRKSIRAFFKPMFGGIDQKAPWYNAVDMCIDRRVTAIFHKHLFRGENKVTTELVEELKQYNTGGLLDGLIDHLDSWIVTTLHKWCRMIGYTNSEEWRLLAKDLYDRCKQ